MKNLQLESSDRVSKFAVVLVVLSLVSSAYSAGANATEVKSPPNILFIAVDDLNDWVGVLGGHPQAVTPNMDKLAERGLLFTNAHCTAPGCNASRTSLLMGLRPSTTGIYQNAHDWRMTSLVESAVHLPQHFKNQGYKTLGAGKLFHAHTFLTQSIFPVLVMQKLGTLTCPH